MMKLLSLFWALTALASGNGVGNGGKVIHCPNGGTPYELFDVWEGRVLFGETAQPCAAATDKECARALLEPLAAKFPQSAQLLLRGVESFERDALLLHDVTLTDVPDDEHQFLPNGCTLEQLAIQGGGNLPPGKLYVVNADLLEKLPREQRVATMLHEVLQGDRAVGVGQSTADVRRIVMGYVTGNVAKMTEEDFCGFYARYKKVWCSVKRGLLEWKTQNDHFMTVGHTRLDWSSEGRLVRLRNDLGVVGFLERGDVSLDTNWTYEQPMVDVAVGDDFLEFREPVLMMLRTADHQKDLGVFRQIRRVDQDRICAGAFQPKPGVPDPGAENGCWRWDSFGN